MNRKVAQYPQAVKDRVDTPDMQEERAFRKLSKLLPSHVIVQTIAAKPLPLMTLKFLSFLN